MRNPYIGNIKGPFHSISILLLLMEFVCVCGHTQTFNFMDIMQKKKHAVYIGQTRIYFWMSNFVVFYILWHIIIAGTNLR